MAKKYLLTYTEQLATDVELLCQNVKAPSNNLSQIRKSSSSVYANIREANYERSKADMLSEFEISLKECSETEDRPQLLFNTQAINEDTFKPYRNLCGRIRQMFIASCKTPKETGEKYCLKAEYTFKHFCPFTTKDDWASSPTLFCYNTD